MKKIREVLRLRYEQGISHAKIAKSVQIGETTVGEYLARATTHGITWPLPSNLDDESLEKLLYPPKPCRSIRRAALDFSYIHKEYQRKGVTLHLLWKEYVQANPNTFAYSHFCDLYKDWSVKHEVWMPQQHKFGEETYVDYSGLTMRIYTSKVLEEYYEAQIFVGVLGASSYIYAEATVTQQLHDWIASHCRMWEFFGGCSELVIPDNLKSGIFAPDRYEPSVNRTYLEMAQHYGCSVVPARVRKPKDKSKVEKAVQDVQNLILGPLRNRKFFCLDEANNALRSGLEELNKKPFQKLLGSRHSLYVEFEKSALKPLPGVPYDFFYWSKNLVPHCYHICVEKHYYSVPYKLVKNTVEVRYNARVVEMFHKGIQVAIHQRSLTVGGYTTNPNHRPPSHQHHADCNPEKLAEWANKIGKNVSQWVEHMLTDDRLHIRQREKMCLGVLRLSKAFGEVRLEEACKHALYYNVFSFKSIESMLKNNLDQKPIPNKEEERLLLPQQHDNIRGPDYFN